MTAQRPVLQKLLTGVVAAAIVRDGYDQVVGTVTLAGDAVGLRTPAELLAAYGAGGEPELVDVLRLELPAVASLERPRAGEERPWPTFPTGFLAGTAVPVWDLGRTRVSYGAEYWRIRADGEQTCLSVYQGAARGWRGAQGWRPPTPLVGARARWGGGDFVADLVGEEVLLAAIGGEVPAGFEEVRPGAATRTVPAGECEVYERVVTATVDGVGVRVLAHDGSVAAVQLLSDDPAAATQLGAGMVEAGVFEARVPADRLGDLRAVENVLDVGTATG